MRIKPRSRRPGPRNKKKKKAAEKHDIAFVKQPDSSLEIRVSYARPYRGDDGQYEGPHSPHPPVDQVPFPSMTTSPRFTTATYQKTSEGKA